MKGLLDAIYWRLHTAYLTNDKLEADKYLSMLEDSMSNKVDLLRAEIGEIHLQRFIKIRQKIQSGEYGRLYGNGNSVPAEYGWVAPQGENEADPDEKAFCKSLLKDKTNLLEAIGCDSTALICSEQVMGIYGRCDFLVRQNRIWKVVEVKMGEAPTSLVSQIDKYRVSAELDMCVGRHDSVEAYTISESYPKYVASELTRASVVLLTHSRTVNSLKRIA